MIKRLFILFSGTVTGVVGVLSYNPPHLASAVNASPIEPATSEQTSANNQPSPATKVEAAPPPAPAAKKKIAPNKGTVTRTPAPAPEPAGTAGTFQGDVIQTRYGPVQVQISVQDGKITNADALAYPNRDRRSLQISQSVIPWLAQETISVQSDAVMSISGATFTSNAWKLSLASALQKAGI